MLRVIIAVVLAAVVQFAWGFVFYNTLSSLDHVTARAPDEQALATALRSALPESGTYFVPACPGKHATEEATKDFEKRAAEGPIVQIQYKKEGFTMAQMPVIMGMDFGHTLLTTLLATFLLRLALPGLQSYLSRVGFVVVVGLFAATARLSDVIWFHHHWAFELGQMVFGVAAWLLAGVVLGAVIYPTGQDAQAATPRQSSLAA